MSVSSDIGPPGRRAGVPAIFYLTGGIRVPATVNMELNRLIKATSSGFVDWANSTDFVFSYFVIPSLLPFSG